MSVTVDMLKADRQMPPQRRNARGPAQEGLAPMHSSAYPEVPDDFGHWLAGFTDGEGCFNVSLRTFPSVPSRAQGYNVSFRIGLRDDDRAILERVKNVTGLGSIVSHGQPYGNQNPSVEWVVAAKDELRQIVCIFDRYPLRAKKARVYAIWRQAVFHYLTIRKGPTTANWGPIPGLHLQLKRVRAYEGANEQPFMPSDDQLELLA